MLINKSRKNRINLALVIKFFLTLIAAFFSFQKVAIAEEGYLIGNLSGELQVQQGMLSYTLPIAVPKGINGLTPDISINYTQGSRNGVMGLGFSLSATSSIQRCFATDRIDGTRSGLQLDSNTRFCLDGKRLVSINGTDGSNNTEYRFHIDNNTKIVSQGGSQYTPSSWKVQSPEGHTYHYEVVGNDLGGIHTQWMLVKKEDVFGNELTYGYTNDDFPLLDSINYLNYTVQFSYDDSTFEPEVYRGGARSVLTKRLGRITISNSQYTLNYYDFNYETVGSTIAVDRLKSVDKCYDEARCIAPVVFNYEPQPVDLDALTTNA